MRRPCPSELSVHAQRSSQPLDVSRRPDVVLAQRHGSVGSHHHGRADDTGVDLAVILLLSPHAPGLHDGVVGVRQQREGQVVTVGELGLRGHGVGRDTDDGVAGGLELLHGVAEVAGLLGATRCAGLGIEVDDDALVRAGAQVVKSHGASVLVGQGELRGAVTGGELGHGSSSGSWAYALILASPPVPAAVDSATYFRDLANVDRDGSTVLLCRGLPPIRQPGGSAVVMPSVPLPDAPARARDERGRLLLPERRARHVRRRARDQPFRGPRHRWLRARCSARS